MNASITPDNRREHTRRALRGTALLLLPGDRNIEVRTQDISEGGLAIVASANPRIGTTFSIRISLPLIPTGRQSINAQVQVIHSIFGGDEGGFKIGLRFVKLDSSSLSAITRYIASRT